MSDPSRPARVLLGLTGLRIDGGIAGVSRCMVRALDDLVASGRLERVDRVLLLDEPRRPPPPPARGEQRLARGSQARFAWQLWRCFRAQRADLVLFDFVGLARAAELPLPGLPPPRSVVFVHGIELGRVRGGSREAALRRAWRILVNSETTRKVLSEQLPEVAEKVRVVPLCLDPERVELWERARQGAPAGPPREPAALIVGRMRSVERGKGHDHLLAAWPAVRARKPDAELWVVGEGDFRPVLEARARELGVQDAVRFLGRVPDDALGDLYRRASVFAMPSRQEGFGLVYAEAMWHGLPCIGSTADAARDVIVDGETGLLVPYGDPAALAAALSDLLEDPERCAALGAAAARHARRAFGYERFRSNFLAALELEPPAARA